MGLILLQGEGAQIGAGGLSSLEPPLALTTELNYITPLKSAKMPVIALENVWPS